MVERAPRIFCDFNGGIEDDLYSLEAAGTLVDLARLGLSLHVGLRLTLYDCDELDNGAPAWVLADAVVIERPTWGLVAKVESPFRWEPRIDPC